MACMIINHIIFLRTLIEDTISQIVIKFSILCILTLKAPITTAADDKFCDISPNCQKNKV